MVKEISGDFEAALMKMINSLVRGEKKYGDILYEWDQMRGNDWFTSTRKIEELE